MKSFVAATAAVLLFWHNSLALDLDYSTSAVNSYVSPRPVYLPSGPVLMQPLKVTDSFLMTERVAIGDDGQYGSGVSLEIIAAGSEAGPPYDAPTGGGIMQTSNPGSFDIVINPGSGLAANAEALAAFNRAAAQWEARISDPISVNINADLKNLGSPNVIGQTSSVGLVGGFDLIRNKVIADAADEGNDDAIVASLLTSDSFGVFLPEGFGLSGGLAATKANLKAIGFEGLDEEFGWQDAQVTFNSTFRFDFDGSDGVASNAMDFETVAAHEIGHALGFVSIVDAIDWWIENDYSGDVAGRIIDLFRFDNNGTSDPATLDDFGEELRSWVPGNDEITDQILAWGTAGDAETRMSTGYFNGDGRQASHWKDNLGLGLMDPTLSFAEVVPVQESDYRAMDLIGYEISLIPEPGTFVLLASGLLVAALAVLRRRWT